MSAPFIDINLLPSASRAPLAGDVWQRLVLPGLLLLGLALLLVMGPSLLKLRNDRALAEQRVELQEVGQEVQSFSAVMAEVYGLQERVALLAVQTEELLSDAERVERSNLPLAPFLDALQGSLLPRMEITGMASTGPESFVVQGTAGSDRLVIDYVSALNARPEIRRVELQSIESRADGALPGSVRWTIEAER